MYTPYHSKYWAAALTCKGAGGSIDSLSRSIASAKVDLNPHQVDAALFAIRSPLSKGVLLADEVGLGKTIEAGLVLSQTWAERRRRLLVIVPATLRKQWQQELLEKFALPSIILESQTYHAARRAGKGNRSGCGRDRQPHTAIQATETSVRARTTSEGSGTSGAAGPGPACWRVDTPPW